MNVKMFRLKRGYTQEEMAKMLNTDQSSYSRKENGKRSFTWDEIKKIKEILDVTYEDILDN